MQRTVARVLLFVGGLAAAISWWAFAAEQTVLNPRATHDVAARLLDAGPVQDAAVRSLSSQLRTGLPTGTDATVAMSIARQAVRDPGLHEAFGEAARTLHEQLLDHGGAHSELVVNTAAVNAALRTALAHAAPDLVKHFRPTPFSMRFDTRRLPNLARARTLMPELRLTGFFVAILAWTLALALHPDRAAASRSIGRRITGVAMVPVMMWVIVPAIMRLLSHELGSDITPVATGYGPRLVRPAVALLVVGVTIWTVARFAGPIRQLAHRRRAAVITSGVVVPLPRRSERAPFHRVHGGAAVGGDGVDLFL